MKIESFQLELITPCFCGGAEPEKQAEIRAPSIRGQLRWWFRTLGGFKSLAPMSVRDQEAMIFGTTAGDEGQAGKLILRVASQTLAEAANADDLEAGMGTPLGYALFPLRSSRDGDGKRGILGTGVSFRLTLLWRGSPDVWSSLRSLVLAWANLGAMGFRARRGFGSIWLKSPSTIELPGIDLALQAFSSPESINVKALKEFVPQTWRGVTAILLNRYRSWRQHGQMNRRWDKNSQRWIPISEGQREENRKAPGFRYARRDHNEGLDVQGTSAPAGDGERPAGKFGTTFRPALGLPIIQHFSSLGSDHGPIKRWVATVNWGLEPSRGAPKGRFASPVLLRPHRDAQGRWHALVIFVDAHKWPAGKKVFLNGQERDVSLDLYEAMKADPALMPFI